MEPSNACKKRTGAGHRLDEEVIGRLRIGDVMVLVSAGEDPRPLPGVLAADPRRCSGCGLCELACSLYHVGSIDPVGSRIRVVEWGPDGFLPVFCQQCAQAPCRAACPVDAISWDDGTGRVVVDYRRCVSCTMCVAACPFGAMQFDRERRIVFKCDLCDGNPQCIHFCETGALTFTDAHRIQYPKMRSAACIMRRY